MRGTSTPPAVNGSSINRLPQQFILKTKYFLKEVVTVAVLATAVVTAAVMAVMTVAVMATAATALVTAAFMAVTATAATAVVTRDCGLHGRNGHGRHSRCDS